MRNLQLQSPDYARVTGCRWSFTHMTILEEKSIIDCLLLTDWNCNILICDIRLFNNVPAHSHKQVPWKKLTIQSFLVWLVLSDQFSWQKYVHRSSNLIKVMNLTTQDATKWFYDRSNRGTSVTHYVLLAGTRDTYSFNHLTIQEFLGAVDLN